MENQIVSLESELLALEGVANQSLSELARLGKCIKQFSRCCRDGDLSGLRKARAEILNSLEQAQAQLEKLRDAWTYSEKEEEQFFASGAYTQELISVAKSAGVVVLEQEGSLACFPSVLKVRPAERAVAVDGKLVRAVHPKRLVGLLLDNQKKAGTTKVEDFLISLHRAYEMLTRQRAAGVCKLLNIYEVLTLRPGQNRAYPLQQFCLDLYLLDASGIHRTPEGLPFRLDRGATASRNRTNLLSLVGRDGAEHTYYGIEFFQGDVKQ